MRDGQLSDDQAALRDAERRIMTAIRTRDIEALEAELAPDFVYSAHGEEDQDRAAFLAAIRDRPYWVLDLTAEGLRIRTFGDVAAVTGMQRARVELSDGAIVTSATAFVDLFERGTDGWRLRHAFGVEVGGGR